MDEWEWDLVLFYYLGDRTVSKTVDYGEFPAREFYYLGDRTVIKTLEPV